jgi:hypothetical protein
MGGSSGPHEAHYDHFGWGVSGAAVTVGHGRLAETHEYFHRQLDDTTAFGGLTSTVAAMADVLPDPAWSGLRRRLLTMSDLVHEMFAVGASLLTTQKALEPIDGYPTYDRHVRTAARLLGPGVHPWVMLASLRAAATACMQSCALGLAAEAGLAQFDPDDLPSMERPNHRLAALLGERFTEAVASEHAQAQATHGTEPWWDAVGGLRLSPEAMDGDAGAASAQVHRRIFEVAASILDDAGGSTLHPDEHHELLRDVLREAQELAPAGLTRIGALVELPGGELIHGGPLDGQVIELRGAPRRGVVLPYKSVSGVSGVDDHAHLFVVVGMPRRFQAAYDLEGIDLPNGEVLGCVRTTVFDGDVRDQVLLLPVEHPDLIEESAPVHVTVMSSAVAASPELASAWLRWADPDRVSMMMDTPATAAIRRWCGGGATFRADARVVAVGHDEVRFVAGRVESSEGRSPLVVIPTTEFGARWLDAARAEDSFLRSAIRDDPGLFERESEILDVLLTHVMLEERFIGTGSWRK